MKTIIKIISILLLAFFVNYILTNDGMLWLTAVVMTPFTAYYTGTGYFLFLGGILLLLPFKDDGWYYIWITIYPLFILLEWILANIGYMNLSCYTNGTTADIHLISPVWFWFTSLIVSILMAVILKFATRFINLNKFWMKESFFCLTINIIVLIITNFHKQL